MTIDKTSLAVARAPEKIRRIDAEIDRLSVQKRDALCQFQLAERRLGGVIADHLINIRRYLAPLLLPARITHPWAGTGSHA